MPFRRQWAKTAPPTPAPPSEAEHHTASVMSNEQVHRVCRVIKGDCLGCPEREIVLGDGCQRGCYAHAVECINVVETGNPWRKTEGVKAPWAVLT